jgi:glycosyltransferase involved in cell wall biosynthesis
VPAKQLHIAWLGPVPADGGGVPGVAGELLHGLAQLGHRIDCFFPATGHELPARLARDQNLTFIWGTSGWRWDRWYSRTRIAAFASGLLARGLASLRLRREIARRHAHDPYHVIYQFSNIETLAVPVGVARAVPLVIHPETHSAGELRFLIAERHLSSRCQPRHMFLAVAAIMSLRALVQRIRIRRARLLVCISGVFRDHMVRDYGFPLEHTVVVANPVRLERFADVEKQAGAPPSVLVLGRIAVRKGIEDVVAGAQALHERHADIHLRVVGGPSLWSDYTKLLEDLPAENAEYAGPTPSSQIPAELARSDILLQASRYEPFALTVAEALAAGVPVVASTEVGAIERVDRSVAATFEPGDIAGMTTAITAMIDRSRANPQQTREQARAEAARLFAPERVCGEISRALERLVAAKGCQNWPPTGSEELPGASGINASAGAGVTSIEKGALAAPSFSGPPGIATRKTSVPAS